MLNKRADNASLIAMTTAAPTVAPAPRSQIANFSRPAPLWRALAACTDDRYDHVYLFPGGLAATDGHRLIMAGHGAWHSPKQWGPDVVIGSWRAGAIKSALRGAKDGSRLWIRDGSRIEQVSAQGTVHQTAHDHGPISRPPPVYAVIPMPDVVAALAYRQYRVCMETIAALTGGRS